MVTGGVVSLPKNMFTVICNNYDSSLSTTNEAMSAVRESGKPVFRPSSSDDSALTLTYMRDGSVINSRLKIVNEASGSQITKVDIAALFPGELSGGKRKTLRKRKSLHKRKTLRKRVNRRKTQHKRKN